MNNQQEKINNFQKIFLKSYGYSISEKEAGEHIKEIKELLGTIIRINHK